MISELNRRQESPRKKQTITDSGSGDTEFLKLFHLPSTEVLIRMTDCIKFKPVLKQVGKIFLFREHVCFESSVFGRNRSNTFVMNQILSVLYDAKKGILTIDEKGKKVQFLQIKDGDTFVQLLISVWEEGKQKESNVNVKTDKEKTKEPKKKEIIHKGSIRIQDSSSKKNLSSEDTITMSTEDWDLVNAGANLVSFKDGEAIINEGQEHHRIYQLATGRCVIKKTTMEGEIVLGLTHPPALFGEMTFLENGKATASVIASGEDCSVYIVEGFYINTLFVDYPALAGRFYSFLATVLAKRLNDREEALTKQEAEVYEKKLKAQNSKKKKVKVKEV